MRCKTERYVTNNVSPIRSDLKQLEYGEHCSPVSFALAVYATGPGCLTVDHCIFKDMIQRGIFFCYGGCICAMKVRLDVLFCQFTNCETNRRGSIYVAMESVVIDACSFDSCFTSEYAAALSAEGATEGISSLSVVISNGICWNCSSNYPAFMMQDQERVDVYNCAFDSCGAGLMLSSVMKGRASNCSFDGCHGQWHCFGIYVVMGDRGHFAVDTCSFSNCSTDGDHGALCFTNGNGGTIQVNSSNFTYCSSRVSGAALKVTRSLVYTALLTYTNCKCENLFTGQNRTICIAFYRKTYALLFENNTFSCCECPCQIWSVITLELGYSTNEFKLSNCVFSGNSNFGVYVGTYLTIVGNGQQPALKLYNCTFQNIAQLNRGESGPGTGILPSGSSFGNITVDSCIFRDLASLNGSAAAAVIEGTPNINITSCTFDGCHSKGSPYHKMQAGAITIRVIDNDPRMFCVIDTCSFRNCTGNNNCHCFLMYLPYYTAFSCQLHLWNSTFSSHTTEKPLVTVCQVYRSGEYPSSIDVSIEGCEFKDNIVTSEDGLVRIQTNKTNRIWYRNCLFLDNQVVDSPSQSNTYGLINLGSISSCERYFESCTFENCIAEGRSVLVTGSARFKDVATLEFRDCVFDGCHTPSGITWTGLKIQQLVVQRCQFERHAISGSCLFNVSNKDTSVRLVLCDIISTAADIMLNVSEVVFESVTTIKSSTLQITTAVYTRAFFRCCMFSFGSDGRFVNISGPQAEITDSVFSVEDSRNQPILQWSGTSISHELTFFNCCFTSTITSESNPYVNLVGTGRVSLGEACFDRPREISIKKSSTITMSYQGDPDTMFGNCVCWLTSEPSSLVTDEPDPLTTWETMEEPTVTTELLLEPTTISEEPEEPTVTTELLLEPTTISEEPEEPTVSKEINEIPTNTKTNDSEGMGSNAGKIAGIAIGVILAVALIVVILLFVLFYRKRSLSSSTTSAPHETTMTEEAGETTMWSDEDERTTAGMWLAESDRWVL